MMKSTSSFSLFSGESNSTTFASSDERKVRRVDLASGELERKEVEAAIAHEGQGVGTDPMKRTSLR